jgi:hypothetical protein
VNGLPPVPDVSWAQVAVYVAMGLTQVLIAAIGVLSIWIQVRAAIQQKVNHDLMNSRLDQLVESKVKESHAIGMAEGTEQARLRAIELLAKGVDDAKATVDKIIERHGNGPDERLEEIRGES